MNELKTESKQNSVFYIILPVFSVICIIAVAVLFYLSYRAPTAEDRAFYAMLFSLSGVVIFPVFYLLYTFGLKKLKMLKIRGGNYWLRWRYPREYQRRDVYFAQEDVYDSDTLVGLLDIFGVRFLNVEIPKDDPSVIRFTNLQYRARSFIKYEQTQEVLIPPGKEEEAEKVVRHYRQFIGRGRELTKKGFRDGILLVAVILIWAFVSFEFIAMPAGSEMKREREQKLKEWSENRREKRKETIMPHWNKIRQTLEPKIEKLKGLPDGQLTPKEAGFDEDSEVKTVFYGRCQPSNDFYISVVLNRVIVEREKTLFAGQIISGAFNFTTSPISTESYKTFCRPKFQESFDSRIILSDRWVYGEINIRPLSETPTPSANSKVNK